MNETAFVYDGTLEGLLTAIFRAYSKRIEPTDIVLAENLQPRLGQEVIEIETKVEEAVRVQKGICNHCGPIVFEAVRNTSLSDDPAIGNIIFQFIRYAIEKNRPHNCSGCPQKMECGGVCTRTRSRSALNEITHPKVAPFVAANRAVYNERHRIMQFLRFEHLEGDLWFAKCNPKASVVPLVMDWFSARFNTQAFMIFDEVHHIAGIYEGKKWYLVKTESITLPEKAQDEAVMNLAWKRFYKTISIESRYNPELRRQFMPKRFWKNITEMHEEVKVADKALKQVNQSLDPSTSRCALRSG